MWKKVIQYNPCMFMYDGKNMIEIELNDKHMSREGRKMRNRKEGEKNGET